MTPTQPWTKAGRRAWAKADGLGPKFDTITITAREWRETIVAIEEEAVSEYREALLGVVEWWDKRVTAESSFEPGFTMSTYDDEDALDSLISKARSLLDRSGVTE